MVLLMGYYMIQKIEISIHQRKPGPGLFSVERLFNQVTTELEKEIDFNKVVSPYENKGILNRCNNILHSYKNRGVVNHITGDVHFLNLLLKKKSTLLTILDCVNLNRLKGIKKILVWFFWYWLPINNSKKITVISEFTKKELLNHININPNKIDVIYCCIPNNILRNEKEFNSHLPKILHIGTAYNKNLMNVIAALNGVNCILTIVGVIDAKIRSHLYNNNILFENYTNLSDNEIYNLYQECDILMFVSTYEGFGMPILEANAIGRPVITSNICSMPEVAGDAAVLVNPFSIEEIHKATISVINSKELRDKLISNGFTNINRFSSKIIADKYKNIYHELYYGNSYL